MTDRPTLETNPALQYKTSNWKQTLGDVSVHIAQIAAGAAFSVAAVTAFVPGEDMLHLSPYFKAEARGERVEITPQMRHEYKTACQFHKFGLASTLCLTGLIVPGAIVVYRRDNKKNAQQ